ncbi:MAG TPA: hypothetical protein VKG90_10205 [Marmoricola sp.]|nr:hypothetical protein [Marmoricola sp.]
MVDVRSPQEYAGDLVAPPGYEQEGVQRAGHIPTAVSIPWSQAVRDDGTFRPREELLELYESGITAGKQVPPTAASASAAPTRGSSSASCWATSTSTTTTVRGRSGATSWTCRSSGASA